MTWTEKQNGLDISDPSHWETLWPRANHTEISLPPPSLHQLGSTGVNGGWCTKSWRTVPYSGTKGYTDPLQV